VEVISLGYADLLELRKSENQKLRNFYEQGKKVDFSELARYHYW